MNRIFLKPEVKAVRFRRLAIFLYLEKIYQRKSKKFGGLDTKVRDKHLVYEFFDTSQGGYHPQLEPVVNTSYVEQLRKKCGQEMIKGYIKIGKGW